MQRPISPQAIDSSYESAERVNLRQLEYFLAIVETGSFTAAAERSHVAQPSLSQQIKTLEAELGGELFERQSRGVRLTAAGRAFLAHARRSVVSADRAVEAARRALRFDGGEIEIATVRSLAVGMLPDSIRRWHQQCPDVSIHLHEFPHPRLVERAVLDGVAELGVGPQPHIWDGPMEPLGWDEFVVVLPPDDPLALPEGPIALSDLADRGWVVFGPPTGLASFMAEACWRAGFEPRPVVETAEVDAAAQLAVAGLGPALVPANAVAHDISACVHKLDPPVVWRVAAFAYQPFSPPATQLIDVLRQGSLLKGCPDSAWVLEHSPGVAHPAGNGRL
jgi:DNA-binding transcriptional LysR family regulator